MKPQAACRPGVPESLRDLAGSLSHDKQVGTIHGLGKDLQGAPSCNGWTFWHYEVDGDVKPIDAARQLYLLASED